ncbi:MAG: tetratricopeptide repeat protein [Kiritimatiellae bacterium]|nr:tetratricopeptide repeat protein [Kiritimatiellia bacterium]
MRQMLSVVFVFAALLSARVSAEEAAAADAPKENPELEAEMRYIEELVNNGYPDIAGPAIEATKKKWPESEARFFAIEIRGMLALGQFDDAEKKIAALPDRKSTKYWAARLEMANNYFSRGQKAECMKIYDEFFKAFPKPPADIRQFYTQACYTYGYLLAQDRQYDKAILRYEALLSTLPQGELSWCDLACETVGLYLKVADGLDPVKDKKVRAEKLAAAEKIVDKLLWLNEQQPLYFGRGVSMKAHIAQMKGNIAQASDIIDNYKPQLQEIHDQILKADPDGKDGFLKQSPLPECLYLQAKMLWDESQAEFKKPKADKDRILELLLGPKPKDGKRDTSKGAFVMANVVFLKYDTSSWAPNAGELATEIGKFVNSTYGNGKTVVRAKITPEQIAKVRAAQFREAAEKFAEGRYEDAIEAYAAVLAKYPEADESVAAVENTASAYLDLTIQTKDATLKDEYRLDADAVEGYLAERFAGSKRKLLMTSAGDAAVRLAKKEADYKNEAAADRLYMMFVENYRAHGNAPTVAAHRASELQKAERFADAMRYWNVIATTYTNSSSYAASLMQLSVCSGKLGDKAGEIEYMTKYLAAETIPLRRLQAQFKLAQMYQRDGLDILAAAATNEAPEAVEAEEKRGTAQIIRAIKTFSGFTAAVDAALKDPATGKEDVGKYRELREAAIFMVGECWSRMNRPEKNLPAYRKRAADSYEAYLAEYPEGRYAKGGYVKLGTIYTALSDLEKSRDALDRLSKKFPDSDEAKNAKPRLAKSLIEMGLKKEGADIYSEMLRTDGAYTPVQFLNAGEALVDAKSWDLANQAFEKAIRLAGTNRNQQVTLARARLGQAKCAWKQGSLAEARESLDRFLGNPDMATLTIAADAYFMMAEVASEQGRAEKDATMRGKHFGAAVGAIKKVRHYWSKKPRWEQDLVDLMSGDVLVRRMKAEEAMGLKEEAKETCGRAAATFQAFIQSHAPDAERPIEKMEPGEVANLERAYSTMIPLFSRQGAEQADRVIKYGQEYLDLFPSGKSRTEVENCMNQAKADLPAGSAAKK